MSFLRDQLEHAGEPCVSILNGGQNGDRAYFDAAYLVGEAAVGGLSGGDLCVVERPSFCIASFGVRWLDTAFHCGGPLSLESSPGKKPQRRTEAEKAKESSSAASQSSVKPEHSQRWLAALDQQLADLPRPLVVDPFAGGGSIPLEALRVGADAFASDLNPIPVLLNKVVLEYIPKYGKRLTDTTKLKSRVVSAPSIPPS